VQHDTAAPADFFFSLRSLVAFPGAPTWPPHGLRGPLAAACATTRINKTAGACLNKGLSVGAALPNLKNLRGVFKLNWQGVVMNYKNLRRNVKAAVLAGAVMALGGTCAYSADMPVKAPPPKPVPFFFVNDTSVSFTWYFNATDPGVAGMSNVVPGGVAGMRNTFYRAQGEIDHFDVWEYGTNLIHIELDQYGKQDPILGTPGAVGSREFFAFTRSTIGFNELTHSKMFSNFLFNDVGFEGGFTAGVQNNFLAEQTTQYLVGLNFDIAIPKQFGTLLVGILARQEFTHNSFNTCGPPGFGVVNSPAGGFGPGAGACAGGGAFTGDRNFGWDWNVEIFDAIPLGGILGSWADPLRIIDITNIRGPKGTGISTANCLAIGCFGPLGAFNNNETKTEVFEDVRLTLDSSQVLWGKKGIWDTYVGYRYWYNKFGTNHNAPLFATVAPGTSIESTAYVGTTYHFK
jgi:hypothetical protein